MASEKKLDYVVVAKSNVCKIEAHLWHTWLCIDLLKVIIPSTQDGCQCCITLMLIYSFLFFPQCGDG